MDSFQTTIAIILILIIFILARVNIALSLFSTIVIGSLLYEGPFLQLKASLFRAGMNRKIYNFSRVNYFWWWVYRCGCS